MDDTHDELHSRLKSAEVIIKWIVGVISALVIGGIFLIKMRYDVDSHKEVILDHDTSIRQLTHNDAVNAQKIDAVKNVVDRIERKLDK